MRFAKAVVKGRIAILVVAFLLMIPSVIGIAQTRINYDMLTYLPDDMDTVIGQDLLLSDFGKGGFSLIVVEDMPDGDIAKLCTRLGDIEHVESVLSYASVSEGAVPAELLPEEIYDEIRTSHSSLIAGFFDSSTTADVTMDAIRAVRSVCGKQCFVTGMSAMVTDLKDLCEKEEPLYVALAVVLACAAMLLLLDSWLIPFVFLLSIGMMILLNMGTNVIFGEISYITKALSAVLQLAVTMDYSIFLWHSYNAMCRIHEDRKEAMACAICETLTSVLGSSITTVAGFIALCFMSFTLGLDLGLVMAKGVILGVISCVTLLPALILVLEKPLQKTRHRSLIPDMTRAAHWITKRFPVFLALFVVLIPFFVYGYTKTNNEVYYDLGQCLPEDMEYVIANSRLSEEFDIASTHMVLLDASVPSKDVREMISRMEDVDGVKYVLGLESVLGSDVPEEILPDRLRELLESDRYELLLINSEYRAASDQVNEQIEKLNVILKQYDAGGMLIGEAPCMKDMVDTTDRDFKVVNAVSILSIFVIIALVERSLILPVILIVVIEVAIFINLGFPHFLGQSLPFIAPICISTIQLGATVDYAILMTTHYKENRRMGRPKRDSVSGALASSIPSILVSGCGLFAATFGVAVYSDIDIISSMCMLMARGAVISMLCVIFALPALLLVFDRLIRHTTLGMKPAGVQKKPTQAIQKSEVSR